MSHHTLNLKSDLSPRRLALQVAVATLSRIFFNTARRFVYPFAPALSRGLEVPLTSITSLIAINQATGFLSLIFGPLGDRWGYRLMMLLSLGALAGGMLLVGLWPVYGVVLVALALAGLGKSIFDPAIQAYVGERVPYHRRGMVIGIIEFGWAGSSLAGIPLAGWLIERFGWQAPFWVLGGCGVVSFMALGSLIPASTARAAAGPALNFRAAWRQVRRSPAALGMLGFGFWMSLANDNLFVVLGIWLEQSFALSLTAIGLSAAVIGLAEFLGETLTASLSDRIGLERAIIGGTLLTIMAYMLLPLTGGALFTGLLGLFFLFLCFEYSLVTSLSLATETIPGARATMMSTLIAIASLGRVLGALIGGPLWLLGGLPAVVIVAAGASGLGLICLWGGLRRNHPGQS